MLDKTVSIGSPESYINRELSWLSFARRVLALAEDRNLPLLERIKFAGIMGMLYDEFSMKRIGGLMRRLEKKSAFSTLMFCTITSTFTPTDTTAPTKVL